MYQSCSLEKMNLNQLNWQCQQNIVSGLSVLAQKQIDGQLEFQNQYAEKLKKITNLNLELKINSLEKQLRSLQEISFKPIFICKYVR